MPRLVRFLVAITVAVGGASIAVSTQPAPVPVFTPLPAGRQVPAAAPFAGDPSIVREQAVGMDLGALFDGASTAGGPAAPAPRITLNVFDEVFVGVFERLDLSAQGYRSWVGTIEGQPYSHVVFTEGGGVVSGLVVAAPEGTFQVRTVEPGVYRLVESAPNQLSPEDEPPPPPTDRLPPVAADEPAGPEDGSLIDVLILYTPRARTEAGGVAQIGALAAQAASDTNTAFQRSGVTTRIRLVGVAELSFDERPTASQDLTALTLSPAAHAVRDQLGADLVQLFVHSPDVGANPSPARSFVRPPLA